MLTTRILPPEEYDRLTGTEAETFIPRLTDAARVVVVERDGVLVACHILQPILHAEGLWVHPAYRKRGKVGGALWAKVCATVREHFGLQGFVTGCASEDVERLLVHLGATKLPDSYAVPIGGR